jgi:hypothetical protein
VAARIAAVLSGLPGLPGTGLPRVEARPAALTRAVTAVRQVLDGAG